MAAEVVAQVGPLLYEGGKWVFHEVEEHVIQDIKDESKKTLYEHIDKIEEVGKKRARRYLEKFESRFKKRGKQYRVGGPGFGEPVPLDTPRPIEMNADDMKEDDFDEIKADLPSNIPSIKARRTRVLGSGVISSFGKLTGYRKMGRKRKRSSRKYCTKRSVKALIARDQAMSNYNRMISAGGLYYGSLTFESGKVKRFARTVFSRTALEGTDYGTGRVDLLIDDDISAKTDVIKENTRYRFKKLRCKWLFHNPMNETVRATFWWLVASEDGDNGPLTWWTLGHTADKNTGTEAFDTNFHSYPTLYPAVRQHHRILKKFTTVFRPGETKTLFTKGRPFQYNKEEGYHEYVKGITHTLMTELKGVPTHQHDSMGVQTSAVNYSQAALDMIYEISVEGARAQIGPKDTEYYKEGRGVVTAAQSLTNDAAAPITTN